MSTETNDSSICTTENKDEFIGSFDSNNNTNISVNNPNNTSHPLNQPCPQKRHPCHRNGARVPACPPQSTNPPYPYSSSSLSSMTPITMLNVTRYQFNTPMEELDILTIWAVLGPDYHAVPVVNPSPPHQVTLHQPASPSPPSHVEIPHNIDFPINNNCHNTAMDRDLDTMYNDTTITPKSFISTAITKADSTLTPLNTFLETQDVDNLSKVEVFNAHHNWLNHLPIQAYTLIYHSQYWLNN